VAVTDQGLFAQVEFSFYDRRGFLTEEIMVTAQGVTGNWIKETVQRWSLKNGAMTLNETLVSRERTITYY
jgi:hypothetical protein